MKSAIYLLAVLSLTLASETIESEPEYQQIIASQQRQFYQNLLSMSPSERERFGLNLNRDSQPNMYDSMPMPMPMSNPWDTMMMPGFPSMGMNMGMYPGYNQMNPMNNRMNSACGCQQVCPPCYFPWMCLPCSCPCQQTTAPPDFDTAPPPADTTTSTTTTTTTTTTPTTTTQAPTTCIPCNNPCNPCGPIWMPWIPCNNVCVCNNGCQTVTPMPARTTVATVPKANNCQCECAPCPPFGHCPPCPKTCPCK